MPDKSDLEEAFIRGWGAAMKRGRLTYELHPVERQTAESIFGQWYDRNYNNDEFIWIDEQ